MRDIRRFEKLAEPKMTIAEFTGEIPSVYERIAEFSGVVQEANSLGVVRSEWKRLFGMEGNQ